MLTKRTSDGTYLVLRGLEEFRKHLGGRLTIPLLRDIAEQFEVNEMDLDMLADCIEQLKNITLAHIE